MRNRILITRVSSLAVAAALTAAASAQSLLGDHGVAFGSVNVVESPDTTDLFVETPSAVLDWTPDDNAVGGGDIIFQPVGTTANFFGSPGFSILNRINVADPSRAVALNGVINGLVDGSTGGNIFFYSPSGFVVGSSAVINVGSLVLSASPITVDGNGNFINGTSVTFGQATNPAAAIRTEVGSAITAPNEGSYVALVAPRVEHRGTINVNGAAALVGAEAATINFRTNGLFDIEIDVGTTDANGVVIDGGVVTGVASSGPGDNHRVYAVAVPKNTALTMLISNGADLGFEIAGAADVVGNTVVLSAGHDVFFGSTGFEQSPVSGGPANITVSDSSLTSAINAQASGDIDVSASAGQLMQFASDVSLASSAGDVTVRATGESALLDIDGDLSISADRFGASAGESVTGGTANVLAQGGGQLVVDGDAVITANGHGGDSFISGTPAGNGTGGEIRIEADAGSVLGIGGNLFVAADGYGGHPGTAGVDAGDGIGGTVHVMTSGNNAALSVNGTSSVSASGFGGHGDGSFNECFGCDGAGGSGTGGTIEIGTGTGSGSTAFLGSTVTLHADGEGGTSNADGIASGLGRGGTVDIFSAGGSQVEGFGTSFASDLVATAIGKGGDSIVAGIAAGSGEGGLVQIRAGADSTLGIFGDLDVDADGQGGFNETGVDGGDGTGGEINLFADGGNAVISVFGSADLEADGDASVVDSDCLVCGGTGGDGSGGFVHVFGGTGTGNFISFAGALDLSAQGFGGLGATGIAGSGTGGSTVIGAPAGVSISAASLTMSANGQGGLGFGGNAGGDGIGGTASIFGDGGSLDVGGTTFLDATGLGGAAEEGGPGGAGTGGIAQVHASAGTLDFTSLFVDGSAEGGNSTGGIGGDATGGVARVSAGGGSILVSGNLVLDGSATGGDGDVGGNATALVSVPPDENQPVAGGIFASAGGSVTVEGFAAINVGAAGGDGANGNGGSAQGGEADVIAFVGQIDLGSLIVDADAFGGDGGNGGAGGNAQGGVADIAFGFGAAPLDGTITLGTALISAEGHGGNGGAGTDANSGGDGGAGGDGLGGDITFTGSAAGGTLISGAATLSVIGVGGAGGSGGNGDAGSGGAGGAGGLGDGGFVQTGTLSGEAAPTSGGGASYTTLDIDASAIGGNGGDGGTGGAGDGDGGDGGAATGGQAGFLARGVLVTADTVTLTADASGGDGGNGATLGNGGDALTGFILVESKDRFNSPAQRGTLEANAITGTAVASGGLGGTNGSSTIADGSYFRVLNGDATIGSVTITLGGDLVNPTDGPSLVSVRDGTATIGTFSFITGGELALDASNGMMTSDEIILSAATFVPDNFNPAPTSPGSYVAGSFDISTGGDFITNAHLQSAADLVISAPGNIAAANLASEGNVQLDASTATVATGDITAGGLVSLLAPTSVTTGDISASGDVSIASGAIDTGAISSGALIDLFATGGIATGGLNASTIWIESETGDISFGDVTADLFDFETAGAVTGGNIIASSSVTGEAEGAIALGDISVGPDLPPAGEFSVGLASATSISVGDVSGVDQVGFATFGDLVTGDVLAGNLIMALVGGDIVTGSLETGPGGQVFMADSQMYIDAGGLEDEFDPALVLASEIIPGGGSVTVGGTINTSMVTIAADGLITLGGDVTADSSTLIAGDLDLASGVTVSGSTNLYSTNAGGTFIGDGLSGAGFMLSNAEYNGFEEVSIEVRPDLGAAPTMFLGDLDIAASVGEAWFAIEDADDNDLGTIRVVGDVRMNNGSGLLGFESRTFQLDASTGSIVISADGTT
ncbi:MAG: hypothetical protein LOX97_11185, partial [Sphingomonas sp.]|nr:hypothetical protein [Sphingomonas sp.]